MAFEGSLGRQPSSAIHCLIASYTAAPVCKQSKKYKYSCPRKWKSLRSFRDLSGMIFAEMQKAADMALILHNKLNVVIKGIAHQIFFYCSNLIFWIVMGCGIATGDLDSRCRGPRLAVQGTSTRGAGDLGAIDLSQGPMAPRVEVHCAVSRGSLWRRESRFLGTK